MAAAAAAATAEGAGAGLEGFDLGGYISRYEGNTCIMRLLHIASVCDGLRLDAARMLVRRLKSTANTTTYRSVLQQFGNELGGSGEFALDEAWIASTDHATQRQLENLESELTAAKSSMVRESVRTAYNAMSAVYLSMGDLSGALKHYVRTRDFCTAPAHTADMCESVIKVALQLGRYVHVNNYATKAQRLDDPALHAKVRAALALSSMHDQMYKQAARAFLSVAPDLGGGFPEVIAPEDLALYGTVCALATLEPSEIRRRIVDNMPFQDVLDLCPQIRQLASDYASGQFGHCLTRLQGLVPLMNMDIYLAEHTDKLVSMVRDRIIVQYFFPYKSVDMNRMAAALEMDVQTLEREVADLISRGKIAGRIDSQNKSLYRREHDGRRAGYERVLQLHKVHMRELQTTLFRLSLMKHGFAVRGSARGLVGMGADEAGMGGMGGGMEAMLMDEFGGGEDMYGDPAGMMMAAGEGGGGRRVYSGQGGGQSAGEVDIMNMQDGM